MKDARGTELRVGQKVAYNFSGTVAHGEITELREPEYATRQGAYSTWQQRTRRALIKVKLSHPAQGKEPGWISKIQDEKNVLVIKAGDEAGCGCAYRTCKEHQHKEGQIA